MDQYPLNIRTRRMTDPSRIRLRKDYSSNWIAKDVVLEQGEPGYELDTKKLRIGDGTSHWLELDFFIPKANIQTMIESSIVPLSVIQDLIEEAISAIGPSDGGAAFGALTQHINSPTPHVAYDEIFDLAILFENGLV